LPPETLVLGFDTAAAHCAAALLCGDRVVATRTEPMATGQAERLMPMLGEMLAEAGVGWGALAALAVGVGPGNFTGVRLSVAAGRGLAMGLGVPAIGVSGFDAAAHGLPRPLLVALDARRGQVYLEGIGMEDAPQAPVLCALDSLPSWAVAARRVAGDAAAAVAAQTGGTTVSPACAPAEAIARIGAARAATGAQPRPAPLYLRDADAAPPRDAAPVLLP
jgi:tRNA threonylcarbamoyladenosine biosynthesis protein TsaB